MQNTEYNSKWKLIVLILRKSVNSSWYHPNEKYYYSIKKEIEEKQKERARKSQNDMFKKMRRVRILNERRFARQTIVQLKRLDSL
jgi:hypothetical protein